ncbi:GTPase HflX [Myceligenerans xiligouense]|uniref:GTPase HflX n=1 Tax=Myceligenerans xiligouense TaxID=253184 RepID=A0A3N4YPL7_9MICO|nr:GTPase HflX [Myceligenerans xiligouense]RPF22077.1 GTP-binding protein HflX [Myceligenerans xiligouense]
MTHVPTEPEAPATEPADPRGAQAIANDVVARVLARAGTARSDGETVHAAHDGDQLDLEERSALRRVAGLSTELDDVTEVEYRQLRLEKVVLVGLYAGGEAASREAEVSMRELAALAETAGSEVLDGLLQRRQKPDPGTYLGSGKAAELAGVVRDVGADTVVVDGELAPSQRRALEDVIKVKVVDRTALILDIFAQHAKSKEGKAQVELAQLEYLLPRLRGWGESMSRQAGGQVGGAGAGMGSRGPGETKIELDRRRIRNRMAKLRREIAAMKPARETKRLSRKRHAIPAVTIAGYTNAGKSSLLNALTGTGVLVENALFATLDPTVRRSRTEDGRVYTLADTVGFVRHLPHQLVEAFRSTLEEVGDADLLLHVVDASHPDPEGQIAAVREVLAEIPGIDDVHEIVVLNKADVADPEVVGRIQRRERNTAVVSAHSGEGIAELRARIAAELPRPGVEIDVVIPYSRGDLVHRVHEHGDIDHTEHVATGTLVRGRVDEQLAAELSRAALAAS